MMKLCHKTHAPFIGKATIALPEPREQQRHIAVTKFEDLLAATASPGHHSPDTQIRAAHVTAPDPTLPVNSANPHGEARFVTLNDCSGVWETLNRLYELIAMPRFSRIKIKRAGVTEIALGDQISENKNLCRGHLRLPDSGTGTCRSHVIADLEFAQLDANPPWS